MNKDDGHSTGSPTRTSNNSNANNSTTDATTATTTAIHSLDVKNVFFDFYHF